MRFLLILLAPLVCLALLSRPVTAFDLFSHCVTESDGTKVCGPCADHPDTPSCNQATTQGGAGNRVTGTSSIINSAANILALAAGIGAVIMIIISGFKFVTAGGATPGQRSGDPNAIKSARATLTAALIGLIIVALAWTITRFITDRLIQ